MIEEQNDIIKTVNGVGTICQLDHTESLVWIEYIQTITSYNNKIADISRKIYELQEELVDTIKTRKRFNNTQNSFAIDIAKKYNIKGQFGKHWSFNPQSREIISLIPQFATKSEMENAIKDILNDKEEKKLK